MKKRAGYSVAAGLFAVAIVFGLAVLMIVKGYGAEVITPVVTGTSLAAAELVRQLRAAASSTPEPERDERRPRDSHTQR